MSTRYRLSTNRPPATDPSPYARCRLPKGAVPELRERLALAPRPLAILASFITQNWRGTPLVTHQVIVNLIAATTTESGLAVGPPSSDKQLALVNLEAHDFHGEWNYTIQEQQHRRNFEYIAVHERVGGVHRSKPGDLRRALSE